MVRAIRGELYGTCLLLEKCDQYAHDQGYYSDFAASFHLLSASEDYLLHALHVT
jgi:hypothetical protein